MISIIGGLVHIQTGYEHKRLTLDKVQALYLDYVNNCITPAGFASWHGFKEDQAPLIIEAGRKINDAFSDMHKALRGEQ